MIPIIIVVFKTYSYLKLVCGDGRATGCTVSVITIIIIIIITPITIITLIMIIIFNLKCAWLKIGASPQAAAAWHPCLQILLLTALQTSLLASTQTSPVLYFFQKLTDANTKDICGREGTTHNDAPSTNLPSNLTCFVSFSSSVYQSLH